MISRAYQGRRPQITFTSDFHELVQGDLSPGPCVLRYDPLRLVSAQNHPAQHIIEAFVRHHPTGDIWHGTLTVPANTPLLDLADPAGQGFMLETSFDIPRGCEELEAWFSCTHDDGGVHWDSDFGRNHWLRFGLYDLKLLSANVRSKGVAKDGFELSLESISSVTSITVRWRVTHPFSPSRRETPLVSTGLNGSAKRWSTPPGGIAAPLGATLAYDLVYTIEGRIFTDDNEGRWYIVCH